MRLSAAAVSLGLVIGLVAGCQRSDDDPTGSASKSSSPTAMATTPRPTTQPATTQPPTSAVPTAPSFAGQVVDITVTGGKVTTAERRVEVKKGAQVRLQVTADVADEVHVHGYDKRVDVRPGAPSTLDFTATLSGRFEVELEKAGLKLIDLQVR